MFKTNNGITSHLRTLQAFPRTRLHLNTTCKIHSPAKAKYVPSGGCKIHLRAGDRNIARSGKDNSEAICHNQALCRQYLRDVQSLYLVRSFGGSVRPNALSAYLRWLKLHDWSRIWTNRLPT